ncbi:MAG: PDZ domain-containing protein, partial [Alphaproteobacteria bacterium]|nr:PDZ domain-containing protein [Alphaproteobacteria bacterium]
DLRGNVVGVNTAIYSPSGGSVGIGFAIPANVASNVIASLRDNGSVSRGFIGVQIQQLTPEIAQSMRLPDAKGALIADVQRGLPAEAAGLRAGDVIIAVNKDKVESPRDLARKIAALNPRQRAEITYRRDGSERKASLTLTAQPGERSAALGQTAPRNNNAAVPAGAYGMTLAPAASTPGAGETGAVVVEIAPDGAAARQGLRSGDVILEVAGRKIAAPADVSAALAEARRNGQPAVLVRVRSGENTRFMALAVRAS